MRAVEGHCRIYRTQKTGLQANHPDVGADLHATATAGNPALKPANRRIIYWCMNKLTFITANLVMGTALMIASAGDQTGAPRGPANDALPIEAISSTGSSTDVFVQGNIDGEVHYVVAPAPEPPGEV